MRITVLGKSPSWQDAGGACSGYLVEHDSTRLLLDCGSGVFGKLRAVCDYVDVDAVVVSHLHADHFFDLMPFACALTFAPRQQPVPVDGWPGTDAPARPQLHLPPGGRASLRMLCAAAGMGEDHIEAAFSTAEFGEGGATLRVKDLAVALQPVPHYVPTFAVDVRGGGGRVTYGADHEPTDRLDAFARATDLLMLEATLTRPERTGARGHLTAAEAGEHATRAGARRLVLTHISDERDAAAARREAAGTYAGPVDVAREGAIFDV